MTTHPIGNQALNWAGALSGSTLLGQAGLDVATQPTPSHSTLYLAMLGLGGIITTLGKLWYDDRRDSRASGIDALKATVERLEADVARITSERDDAEDRADTYEQHLLLAKGRHPDVDLPAGAVFVGQCGERCPNAGGVELPVDGDD